MERKSALTKIRRMAINAVMTAVYIVLSTYLAINMGGLKLTFEALPVVLCAVIFGPVDAMAVGFLGELLNQMLTYGFTPTTLLWILPIVARGLIIGMCVAAMKKKQGLSGFLQPRNYISFLIISIAASLIHSLLNTAAFYVDSKMLGYYSYHSVFGLLLVRLLGGILSAVIMSMVTVPLAAALKRAKLIS